MKRAKSFMQVLGHGPTNACPFPSPLLIMVVFWMKSGEDYGCLFRGRFPMGCVHRKMV
jgi:hypothetical protein